jgi:hypothetical protein
VIKKPALTGLVVLAVLALAGCSTGQEDEVRSTAHRFYQAIADKDGAAACGVLAPRTRSELEQSAKKDCASAVLEESLPQVTTPRSVQAYGTMSQVRYGSETAFLSRYGDSWKVYAAGCKPPSSQSTPYDCQISGG